MTTPFGTVGGNVSIGYSLASTAEWASCNITAQYSTDGGASWHAATSGPGGSGTGGLSVTPSGNAYTYVWNSSADLGASLDSNVLFKIAPTDAAGFGTPGATAGFAADDRHSPPVIGSLTASPEPVALGGNLTLTASNVVDTDGSVVGVRFYRDVNGNGSIDVGADQYLGTGTQSGSTWTWTGATTGLTLGTDTYMAVATDDASASSNTATATGTVYPAGEYVVNSTADNVAVDGYVTLREAILAANSNTAVGDAHAGSSSTTDVIVFSSSLNGQTINLAAALGELPISDNVTVIGPGANQLTINAGGLSRIFDVAAGITVTISGLTLEGGSTASGGGAVYNSGGTVSLNAVTITASSAAGGGGVSSAGGVLTISNSTIYGNRAQRDPGAAWPLRVGRQSSINRPYRATPRSEARAAASTAPRPGRSSSAKVPSHWISAIQGGGIYAQSALPLLTNTLVAQDQASLSGADVYGGFSTSSAYNLIGVVDSTATGLTADPHTQAGTAAVPLDSMLGLLGSNGGPTPTQSLLTGSLAIDAGSSALARRHRRQPAYDRPARSGPARRRRRGHRATEGSLAPGLIITGPANGTSIDLGETTVFTWDPRTIPIDGLIQLYLDPDSAVSGNELPVAVNVPAAAANGEFSWAPTLQPAGQYTVGGSVTDPLSGQTWSDRMAGKIQITYSNFTIVNSVSDVVASGNLTTLREAILQSNANPRGGGGYNVIFFDPRPGGGNDHLVGLRSADHCERRYFGVRGRHR